MTYIRLSLTGDPTVHVHVDIARREYFVKSPPIVTHKRRDILQALAAYSNEPLHLTVSASFLVLVSDLPTDGLIQIGPTRSVAGAKISLTGARLSLENASIDLIDWQRYGDAMFIHLTFDRDGVLTDDYLNEALNSATKALGTYVFASAPSR